MPITYSNNLITQIEKSLQERFNQPSLRIGRKTERDKASFTVSVLQDYINVVPIGNDRFGLEIMTAGIPPDTFFFGFVARFRVGPKEGRAYNHELDHISLSVLQKYPTGDIYSLFRAEWDEDAALSSNAHHAQPHWHFTQNAREIEASVITLGGSPAEFGAERIFDGMIEAAGVHFAMSPLWHPENENCYKQIFSSMQEVTGWFDALTKYIAEQLIYVCSGLQPQTVLREFQSSNSIF